jgi:hypothetical protein
MEDFAIQYQGFSPSPFAQNYVRDLMAKIHEEAPSASHMKVTISKVDDRAFRGLVRITSHAGSFNAIASGAGFIEVAHELFDRMRRQLEKWKDRRFDRESIRRPQRLFPRHEWRNRGSPHSDPKVS